MLGYTPLPRTLAAALRDRAHPRLEVRLGAVADLGRLARAGSPDAEAAAGGLLASLEDGQARVRGEAAVYLADVGAVAAVPALLRLAAGDPSGRVRQLALLAAGELAEDERAAAEHRSQVALRARAVLDDDDPALRFQGLIALSRLDREGFERALPAALRDADPEVRYIAVRLAEEADLCATPPVATLVARALSDAALPVRAAAALALSRTRDETALEVLVQLVNGRPGALAPEDESAAVERVGELGLGAALGGLQRRAFGWFGKARGPTAFQALVALARLGDERARRTILGDLRALTRDTRTLAVAAAGRAGLHEARPLLEALRQAPSRVDPEAVAEALAALDAAARGEPPGGGPGAGIAGARGS